MELVRITQVSRAVVGQEDLWGFAIDVPKPGATSRIWAIRVRGWVLGKRARVTDVECFSPSGLNRTMPVGKSRPDVAKTFTHVPHAEQSGFDALLGVIGLDREFAIHLRARYADGSSIPLGVVTGSRCPLKTRIRPRLQPLMVTSLGRTGSTWLMAVLAQHSGIVANRRYPFETLASSYWTQMLKVLSQPANYVQSSHPLAFPGNSWLIGHNPFFLEPLLPQTPARRRSAVYWLGRGYIRDLAAFCQRSIDGYYRRVARGQRQAAARFFVEKHQAGHVPAMLWELYPEGREIFLVRDFRDVFCSVVAMNARRGSPGFGRENVDSDEAYVYWLRSASLRWRDDWRRRSAHAHLLRYEDLIQRPEETITAVLTYLGLDSAPATVRGMIERANAETPELARHGTGGDPQSSIGRWQRALLPSLQARCNEAFAELLQEFGYDTQLAGSGAAALQEPDAEAMAPLEARSPDITLA